MRIFFGLVFAACLLATVLGVRKSRSVRERRAEKIPWGRIGADQSDVYDRCHLIGVGDGAARTVKRQSSASSLIYNQRPSHVQMILRRINFLVLVGLRIVTSEETNLFLSIRAPAELF